MKYKTLLIYTCILVNSCRYLAFIKEISCHYVCMVKVKSNHDCLYTFIFFSKISYSLVIQERVKEIEERKKLKE